MNKSKFIAATITTLVLFAMVRVFNSSPTKSSIKIEKEAGEIRGATLKKNGAVFLENSKIKNVKLIDKEYRKKSAALKEANEDINGSLFFSKKSDYVYFKVQDGIALVGGDIVLGEFKGELGLKNRLLKDKPLESKLWKSFEIPFGFSENFPQDLKIKALEAIKYFNQETIMEFVPINIELDKDAIVFKFREDVPCSSYLGRVGGFQPVYLRSSCSTQDVIHELMHALGFVHEQQREDRNRYLKVLWENIDKNFQHNFAILPDTLVHQYEGSVFNISFNSIMMYDDKAFAKPGLKSLESLIKDKISPINNGLSDIDKERLKLLYGA